MNDAQDSKDFAQELEIVCAKLRDDFPHISWKVILFKETLFILPMWEAKK